jgi:uncharacterized protein HemX
MILALWVALIFGAFVFYWVNIRPVKIRSVCAVMANKYSVQVKSKFSDSTKVYQAVYSECLKGYGLEK